MQQKSSGQLLRPAAPLAAPRPARLSAVGRGRRRGARVPCRASYVEGSAGWDLGQPSLQPLTWVGEQGRALVSGIVAQNAKKAANSWMARLMVSACVRATLYLSDPGRLLA